jgi:hypothetical protein
MTAAARLSAALLAVGLCACESYAWVGSDCAHEQCAAGGDDGMPGEDVTLPSGPPTIGEIDQLDLLLVIDNSMTMMEEQQAFASVLPRLIERLASGNLDNDRNEMPEFHAVQDIQLGVVSTDLGLGGVSDVDRCFGVGNDGELTGGCGGVRPFASSSDAGTIGALAMDAVCRVQLGTEGCGFEQPLEAALRALAPAPQGHGDDLNEGFLREDSLLVVLQLTDEEDCSMRDTRIITPARALPVDDPLAAQGLNVRCTNNPEALYPTNRYVDGLRALRPGAEDRVMFFAIAGVPPEMVSADVVRPGMLEDADERERFYSSILDAPAMRESIDDRGTPDPDDDAVNPVCDGENGAAFPARRLVQVARGFGMNGLVQSICERELSRAIDIILRSIARRLGTVGI